MGAMDRETLVVWVSKELRHSLQALAVPADVQLRLLPDFVCKADELALNFNDCYSLITAEAELTDRQKAALDALDAKLDEMGGAGNEHLWTEKALGIRPEWEEVRRLAVETLDAFGWDVAIPPAYVRGSQPE